MAMQENVEVTGQSLSRFESIFASNPPLLESLLLHAPTATIFQLYHTSSYLRRFLRSYPAAWKYLSFRLLQPSSSPPPPPVTGTGPHGSALRISRNYALDQMLVTVINPLSSCLKSLELDNTAVSGQTLISRVLSLRRETLQHLSVRGCKNVSLKYHLIPWLTLFNLQMAGAEEETDPRTGYQKLALKSLYAYRCRHHRRRPYLPSSLSRKDSDSEPTHELVNLCHQLGIWTDTAWCTTPGVRCFRRRGYNAMRASAEPKEVWVVFDRLWRSKNWIGGVDGPAAPSANPPKSAPRDGRIWEQEEEGQAGEALGPGSGRARYGDGKHVPTHQRRTHREFVENIVCDKCACAISERCEQCSVLMHCTGCRKTLCASCAFDRPYTLNRAHEATVYDESDRRLRDKFWWAPGCSVSPCSMIDDDEQPTVWGPHFAPRQSPTSKMKWCCTEPVFSGGGGITFGPGHHGREFERLRAAPLPRGERWEDPEFGCRSGPPAPVLRAQARLPATRTHLDKADHYDVMHQLLGDAEVPAAVPRNLCGDCYGSRAWRVRCVACSQALCLQHDLRGLRMRICGYRGLVAEKEALARRHRSIEQMAQSLEKIKGYLPPGDWSHLSKLPRFREDDGGDEEGEAGGNDAGAPGRITASEEHSQENSHLADLMRWSMFPAFASAEVEPLPDDWPAEASTSDGNHAEQDRPNRPGSPSSNATAAASRSTSPAPSVESVTAPAAPSAHAPRHQHDSIGPHPKWSGCLSFACPQFRVAGDHRVRCHALFRECASCKVNVCKSCADQMPRPCGCDGCVERPRGGGAHPAGPAAAVHGGPVAVQIQNPDGHTVATLPAAPPLPLPPGAEPVATNPMADPNANTTAAAVLVAAADPSLTTGVAGDGPAPNATSPFWCPNCRWERAWFGHCKARQLKRKTHERKGKEKDPAGGRRRGRGSMGSSARNLPVSTGIDDETAQNIAEFEDLIQREEAEAKRAAFVDAVHAVASISGSVVALPAPPSGEGDGAGEVGSAAGTGNDGFAAEEQDLDRISAMVGDLQNRIDRLRVVYAARRDPQADPQGSSSQSATAAAAQEHEVCTAEAAAVAAAAAIVAATGSGSGSGEVGDESDAVMVAPDLD